MTYIPYRFPKWRISHGKKISQIIFSKSRWLVQSSSKICSSEALPHNKWRQSTLESPMLQCPFQIRIHSFETLWNPYASHVQSKKKSRHAPKFIKPIWNPSLFHHFSQHFAAVTARRQSPEWSASMAFKLPEIAGFSGWEPHVCHCSSENSMDWFQGKFTGKPHI